MKGRDRKERKKVQRDGESIERWRKNREMEKEQRDGERDGEGERRYRKRKRRRKKDSERDREKEKEREAKKREREIKERERERETDEGESEKDRGSTIFKEREGGGIENVLSSRFSHQRPRIREKFFNGRGCVIHFMIVPMIRPPFVIDFIGNFVQLGFP